MTFTTQTLTSDELQRLAVVEAQTSSRLNPLSQEGGTAFRRRIFPKW
jgi:hypothetical protein